MEMHRKRHMVNLWSEIELVILKEENVSRIVIFGNNLPACRLPTRILRYTFPGAWNAQGTRMVTPGAFGADNYSFHHPSQCLYRCIHSGHSTAGRALFSHVTHI